MTGVLQFALRDIVSDWRRSLTHVAAIVPIVAAYLILIAIAGGLRGESEEIEAQNIVILSPNALDPASGRLDPSVLDLARNIGGDDVASATPMILRPIRMDDRIVQLRAAPFSTWQPIHDLTLLEGSWPDDPDEIVITEGIAIATDWTVGTRAEIFGTSFKVSALVRAPGTKFASVWMPYDRADLLFEGQSGFQMVTVEPADGADFRELRNRLDAASNDQFSVYFEAEFAELQTARRGAAENLAKVATIVGIAALVFGGFNLAAISLAERRRDLGIARSVGVSRNALGGLSVIRASLLATVGFILGGVAAIGALALTSASTVRSFVFEPVIPPTSWALGALITITVSAAGSWLAFRSATRTSVKDLLEAR